MKKFTFSLIIAVIIHIIVLVLSGFLIGEKPDTFFEYQNTIPLQFGNGTTSEKNSVAPRKRNKIEFNKNTNSSETSTPSIATDSGTGSVSGDMSSGNNQNGSSFESSIIGYLAPSYPRVAQVRGLEGSVVLKIKVTPEGSADETAILKSSGHDILDRAALEVVPKWRFQKKAAPYTVEKTILFQLKN